MAASECDAVSPLLSLFLPCRYLPPIVVAINLFTSRALYRSALNLAGGFLRRRLVHHRRRRRLVVITSFNVSRIRVFIAYPIEGREGWIAFADSDTRVSRGRSGRRGKRDRRSLNARLSFDLSGRSERPGPAVPRAPDKSSCRFPARLLIKLRVTIN